MLTVKDSLNVSNNIMHLYDWIVEGEIELGGLEQKNKYREKMIPIYTAYITNMIRCYSGTPMASELLEWYEFNVDFIGFMNPWEINESLENIIQKDLRKAS